ncbi:MAG: protein TolA [Gammaproteobacteria bacterium RIFCSPHIGHO2_12_FULL_38_14]|nr:MAG: protein TolA [Gammaproteobacteria bacterium RIFCSPHIGHO2_12_FULL_38_14]
MLTISKNYRKPVIFAILLHLILLSFFIFELSATQYRLENSAPNQAAKTIQVKAISVAKMQMEIKTAAAQQQQQQIAQQKLLAEKQAQINAEKKAVELKAEKAKLVLQMAAEKKARAEKTKQEKIIAAKKAVILKKQKLAQEQEALQKQLMAQQIQSDQHSIAKAQSQANQGVIDQYKAQILSAIQANWRISQVNDKLKCIYLVQIAPGGTVLSAQLEQSSGDSALDQSAREAIFKSSPLPVPKDLAEFNSFRRLVLTLSPQGYLQ